MGVIALSNDGVVRRTTTLGRNAGVPNRRLKDYNFPMRRVAAALVLLFAHAAALGSPTDPCSPTSTVTDARVSIAFSDGRTSFREGEIIPLVLSFTSTADKRYWADNRNYDRSGRLNIETYCVEPDVVAGFGKLSAEG